VHRSRLALLVVFAPVAACATRKSKDPEGTAPLSQDSSLAHLDLRQLAAQPQLPDECGTVASATAPTGDNERQAGELTRQAYKAELVGDVQQAHVLLHRAAELDGTSKPIAYHLGRTSEELGDRTGAVNAYCHYLALSPATADTADVRQRLTRLSPSLHVATTSVSPGVASRRFTPVAAPRRARRTVSRVASAVRGPSAGVRLPGGGMGSGDVDRADYPPPPDGGTHRTTADGDVVATTQPTASTQPATTSSRRRGGLSHAQGAGIGAAAGAIIAGATGRSVKSAVLGAAAGGILGAVVVGGTNQ